MSFSEESFFILSSINNIGCCISLKLLDEFTVILEQDIKSVCDYRFLQKRERWIVKWNRFFSLQQWAHVFKRLPSLLTSRELPLGEKLLFLIPVLTYWVLPDVMPFMPIDDIGVTLLMMNWFVSRAERKTAFVYEQKKVR